MKPELLDPLLRDRALGELSPAVAALLDAHLAQDPAATRRAAEFAETIRLARTAVASPLETPRRPLDLARLRRVHSATHAAPRRMEIFRLAACLALGLALGWLVRPAREVVARAPAVAALTPMRATDPATQFWSVARFAPETAKLQIQKRR